MEVVEVHGGGGVGACWRWMVEVMEVGGGGGGGCGGGWWRCWRC